MADDIDDLLNEAETLIISPNKTCTETRLWEPRSSVKVEDLSKERKKVKSCFKLEDLSDLLDDFEEPPAQNSVPWSGNVGSNITRTGGSDKEQCCPVYLGGSNILTGRSTGQSTTRACDHLRCLSCDFIVKHMDGFTWRANIDYLFLRNNFPDMDRLRARLEPSRGSRAYACQCKHRSVDILTTIDKDKGLQWVCAKH